MDKYKNLFSKKMNQEIPIELFLRLNLNQMTEQGDSFDTAGESLLTKGRALPAWDNNSLFNTAVITGDKGTLTNKGFFPTSNEISDKYKKTNLPNNDPTQPDHVDVISGASDSHEELITNITGQGDTTVHTATSNDSDPAKNIANWSKDQFNPNNIDITNGNAFPTWNQYISLYDTKGIHNTKADDGEKAKVLVNGKQTVAKTTLPGSYSLDRTLTLNKDDKFIPMDYYRSINYFTKEDTTAATKKNVTWALPARKAGAGADETKKNGEQVINPGETITVYYYGTDENGNVFSPAKLPVTKRKYNLPTIQGSSKLTFNDQINTDTIKNVHQNYIITQTDTFESNIAINDGEISLGTNTEQKIHVEYPSDDVELVESNEITFGDTRATVVPTETNGKVSGFDVMIPKNYQIHTTHKAVSFTYHYKITSDQAKQVQVGKTTYAATLSSPIAEVAEEDKSANATSNRATIEINEFAVQLSHVPGIVDFGDGMDPLLTQTYFNKPDGENSNFISISSNGKFEGPWILTAELNSPTGENAGVDVAPGNFPGTLSYLSKNTGLENKDLPFIENKLLLGEPSVIYSGNKLEADSQGNPGTIYKDDKWSLAINPRLKETDQVPGSSANPGEINSNYIQPQINTLYQAKVTWTLGFGPTS